MRPLLVVLLTAACLGTTTPVLAYGPPWIADWRDRTPTGLRTTLVTDAPVAQSPPHGVSAPHAKSPLEGKRLRYLIGTEASEPGDDNAVTAVSYDTTRPVRRGVSIAYCNLFDERNTGRYGPYLSPSDTADAYDEGQIDPRGPGWEKNLREQFERRKKEGFEYIELDNADAYSINDVIAAIDLAASYAFKVVAKNPGLMHGTARKHRRPRSDAATGTGY